MSSTPQYTSSPPTNTLAIVSLVSGILSWIFFPVLAAIVGVITGHMARREIRNSYGAQSGDGLALAGLVISYANLALSCVSLLLFVLFFGGMIGLSACAVLSESANLVSSSQLLESLLSY